MEKITRILNQTNDQRVIIDLTIEPNFRI